MERDAWIREYKRLLTAYNKSPNNEQVDVYFVALSAYPQLAIAAAVTGAIRESRGWPSVADLVDRARNYLAGHAAPSASCDVCHGERFTQHTCEDASPGINTPCVSCGQKHPKHANGFWFAKCCYQCHPGTRMTDPAA